MPTEHPFDGLFEKVSLRIEFRPKTPLVWILLTMVFTRIFCPRFLPEHLDLVNNECTGVHRLPTSIHPITVIDHVTPYC